MDEPGDPRDGFNAGWDDVLEPARAKGMRASADAPAMRMPEPVVQCATMKRAARPSTTKV